MTETLHEKLARLRAERLAEPSGMEPRAAAAEFDTDLVPDPCPEQRPEDVELDRVVDEIDILDAYRKWCGKIEPKAGSKREGVKVSCPIPSHPDRDPSAWVNLDEQVWYCGGCELGGDKFDIAAWHFGHSVPGYKTDGSFPELRRKMAQDFGFTVIRSGGTEWAEKPHLPPDPAQDSQSLSPEAKSTARPAGAAAGRQDARIIPLPRLDDQPAEDPPAIAWRDIVTPDTFLWRWMELTEPYDLPTEFYFWLGVQAVAAAIGDDARLIDYPPVEANLYVCLCGPTGIGKSRATHALMEQLKESLPYDRNDPNSKGVLAAREPASGEALLKLFSKPELDPADPKTILGYRQVRALVRFDELAALTGKSARQGNTLKPRIISLYDGDAQGDTAITRDDIIVENPYCQMVSTTQPGKIRDLLTQGDADSGFINRWIFAMGPPKPLKSHGRAPFDPSVLSMDLKRIHGWAAFGRPYLLEGAAADAWEAFFRRELEPIKTAEDGSPLLSRSDLTMFKLMVIFAANDMSMEITADHVRQATALWPYLRESYDRVGSEISVSTLDDCADAILEAIPALRPKLSRDPTARDIWDRRIKGRKRWSIDVYRKALAILQDIGKIEELLPPKEDGRGRPRYRLVGD